MHRQTYLDHVQSQLDTIKRDGFYKAERVIAAPQSTDVRLNDGSQVLNFCANNYLGLADDPRLIDAAKASLDENGFGMASVRFICGTQSVHKQLEERLAAYLQKDAAILYSSCFDANVGLFETLLDNNDAIISDELNHASIIDGIRLCKAKRFRYRNNNLQDLEQKLIDADQAGARFKLIATDGVFSMDGIVADLKGICDLADQYGAMVMVDDSHAVGFVGDKGRGTPHLCGVHDRVDIVTGTFGKALGGASGGYVAAQGPIVDLLRQRSRPYLFSNALAPQIAAATLRVIDLLDSAEGDALRRQVQENGLYFRDRMTALGFNLIPGQHPIIPVMLQDASLATTMANKLLEKGVYVIGFSFPVVPKGQARIRPQMSATHTRDQLDRAIDAFATTGRELGVI
ncbi:MAG TPA: glycine C-acetyltransferase [Burkholderiaceae bacterium]|nr:glycine C-acetyltransferase [Burkholderiaceae bacterium]